MVNAHFINDTTPVEVHGENEQTTVNVTSKSEVKKVNIYSAGDHENLTGREKDNQHPISAITGLTEALQDGYDKNFVFEQEIPTDTWEITHNLGKNPSVTVVDSAGNMQFPDEVKYDNNTVTIKFVGSFAGKAFLN